MGNAWRVVAWRGEIRLVADGGREVAVACSHCGKGFRSLSVRCASGLQPG